MHTDCQIEEWVQCVALQELDPFVSFKTCTCGQAKPCGKPSFFCMATPPPPASQAQYIRVWRLQLWSPDILTPSAINLGIICCSRDVIHVRRVLAACTRFVFVRYLPACMSFDIKRLCTVSA